MFSRGSTAVLFLLVFIPLTGHQIAQSPNLISLQDRVLVASKIYQQITTFYPDVSLKQFDQDYAEYVGQILGVANDRVSFDLLSMAFVAKLHDGHTWFYDNWIAQNHGQPIGLEVYPWDGQWVVVRSRLASLRAGDVIEAVDGTPTQKFFEQNRKYISASSDRDAGVSLFDTPVLFPERFTLTLDGGRHVAIDRRNDAKSEPVVKTEGHWLVPGSVGYIKVPTFHGLETQLAALGYLRQFHEAGAVILDIRGNPGTGDPGILERALMDKPYPMWADHSKMHGGFLLRNYNVAYPEGTQIRITDAVIRPREQPVYAGRLILLIDRGCSCACEDFTMPFKFTKRAELVGENTAGTFSFTNSTQFENGMRLNIASVRHTFPDGSRFEGVGVAPDVEARSTAQDLKAGKDAVLERALALATGK